MILRTDIDTRAAEFITNAESMRSLVADLRDKVENDVRCANITIIEDHDASQYGIGIVSARIAEMVLRDERSAILIGSY